MKYVVKVDGRRYEVLLDNLHAQPVVALVDGHPIEVWLESENQVQPYFALTNIDSRRDAVPGAKAPTPETNPGGPGFPRPSAASDEPNVRAPLPGVVVSVNVKPGQQVETGEPLCVIEAMKMKNAIRAPRPGKIATVGVIPGQNVAHNDVLVEFEA